MLCSFLKVTSGRTGTRTYFENLPKIFLVQFWATSLSTYIIKESETFLQLLKDLMNIA